MQYFPNNRWSVRLNSNYWHALLLCLGFVGIFSSLQALEYDSNINANPAVTAGYAQLEAGQTEVALKAFQRVLETDSNDLSAQLGQAMIFAKLKRHPQAFTSYDAIVQRFPRHAFAWNGRGLAAFNMEDFDEALNSFEQATADQPVNGFFYEALAWTRMCRGEFTQAAESAKHATLMYNRRGETSAYPLFIAYFAYLETGDSDNARRALNYAVANKSQDQWPTPVIDYLSKKITAEQLISCITNTTEETEAHTYIGLNLHQQGDLKGTMAHLEWVSQHGDPEVFEYTLARAFNMQSSVAALAN
jgi:tetratricopeptide (TPR) repeat protein